MCVALGFFDSIHKGHAAIITGIVSHARETGCLSAVMTFDNNPFYALGYDTKLIYTFSERCGILKNLGADIVIAAEFDRAFMSTPAAEFLRMLNAGKNIRMISCGEDYKFGQNSEGDVALLRGFCEKNGIQLSIVPQIKAGAVKVSSSLIRGKLLSGDIEGANLLLGSPYSVSARVSEGRHIGTALTYPTANIQLDPEKLQIKAGVYFTNVYIDGTKYMGVTNAGGKPTFGLDNYSVETYIINYNSDLYGQYIKVEFIKRVRGIQAFSSASELKAMIAKDIALRYKEG